LCAATTLSYFTEMVTISVLCVLLCVCVCVSFGFDWILDVAMAPYQVPDLPVVLSAVGVPTLGLSLKI